MVKPPLLNAVRGQGLEHLREVKAAYLEGDGSINVIPTGRQTV